MKFNERLKACIAQEPKLKWLDFLNQLLTADKSKLLPKYGK